VSNVGLTPFFDAGVLAYKANDIPDAKEWFLKALQTDPSHQQALRALQQMYQTPANNQISGFPSKDN
jgi:Tfp pilus assembly protein PilF